MHPIHIRCRGKKIEELDPSVLRRVPIRDDYNEEYFPNDSFQFMPKDGYTKVFELMLDQEQGYVTADGRQIGGTVMDMRNITLRFGGVTRLRISALIFAKVKFARSSDPMVRVNHLC